MTAYNYDLYLIGVGGQGIGLLSEVLIRAIDAAGLPVRGVDTHGLAQRGGVVVSNIRVGSKAHAPIVSPGKASICIALERSEALRGLNTHLADRGTLVYYDCLWQPLGVRLGKAKPVENELISQECHSRGITVIRVFEKDLPDTRMQNVAVLAHMASNGVVKGVSTSHFEQALTDLMTGKTLEANLALFRAIATSIKK